MTYLLIGYQPVEPPPPKKKILRSRPEMRADPILIGGGWDRLIKFLKSAVAEIRL